MQGRGDGSVTGAPRRMPVLFVTAGQQSLFARLRIDQTVGLWWRTGAVLALIQLLVLIALKFAGVRL